jgi:hypothetical protein
MTVMIGVRALGGTSCWLGCSRFLFDDDDRVEDG